MLELIVAHNALIREVLNGSLFPLFIVLSLTIGVFLYDTYNSRRSLRYWSKTGGVQTGLVLLPLFFFEGVRAGLVWLAYRVESIPNPVTQNVSGLSSLGFIVAASVLIICALRATFIFTPARWGNTTWIASAAFTAAFNIVSVLTDVYAII